MEARLRGVSNVKDFSLFEAFVTYLVHEPTYLIKKYFSKNATLRTDKIDGLKRYADSALLSAINIIPISPRISKRGSECTFLVDSFH